MNHALASFDRLLLIKDGMLVGDHPADNTAIPHLERLYDIGFERLIAANGDTLVKPIRRHASLKVAS